MVPASGVYRRGAPRRRGAGGVAEGAGEGGGDDGAGRAWAGASELDGDPGTYHDFFFCQYILVSFCLLFCVLFRALFFFFTFFVFGSVLVGFCSFFNFLFY